MFACVLGEDAKEGKEKERGGKSRCVCLFTNEGKNEGNSKGKMIEFVLVLEVRFCETIEFVYAPPLP